MVFSVEDEVKFAGIPASGTFSGSERSAVGKFGQKKKEQTKHAAKTLK